VRFVRLSAEPLGVERMADEDDITVTLTRDEAIVLFEFLTRYSSASGELKIVDQAEQRVLSDIQAILESTLPEPINNPGYEERVARARSAVRDEA
jgi:hypothetical protein